MPADLLVKLYNVEDDPALVGALKKKGIRIVRAMPLDKAEVLDFIRQHFAQSPCWVSETERAFTNHPLSCYIAIHEKQVIGFGCYDATAKNFFGPTGVREDWRGHAIGTALLKKCLLSMKEEGYGYAIIGWVGDALPFYQKVVDAMIIPDSFPGIYQDMIRAKE